ncbi:MAG TPA: Ig-like domain-containing protein [Solirubrobacteraceae bacterium]|nr:Ig-like domain-containing protein [Solirubrobacteraceae bacterium]
MHRNVDHRRGGTQRGGSPRRRIGSAGIGAALIAAALALTALFALAPSAGAVSDETAVSLGGNPLSVYVGPRGQCQSSYLVNGVVNNNYYPGDSQVGDCGFFLAFPKAGAGQPANLQGKTFGFEGHAGPGSIAGEGLSGIYTPVSQSPVTGDGSAGNPLSQTTVFKVIDSGAKEDALVTETTTYVNGAPQFTSVFNVKNTSGSTLYFRAMYAGDLYVNGNDRGIGSFLAGPPRFIGGQNTGSGILGGFIEAGEPFLPWSSFQEAFWSNPLGAYSPTDDGIWNAVETTVEDERAFNETIEPQEVDDGAGVEWDQLRTTGLANGKEQSFAIINRTQIPSSLVVQPVAQNRTVGQTATITVTATDNVGTPYANRPLVYSIGGANPKTGSVTTNAAGQAVISYVGTAAGIDTLQMFLDLNANGGQDTSEPSSAAQVIWVPAPPTPNSSYRIQSIKANSDGTVTITFVPTQDGTATVEVTVPTATISRNASAAKAKKCKRGQIKIHGKCRPKSTVSGKVTAKGKAGVPLKITVKPSRKVKQALAKGKKVSLTAKLTYKSVLGGAPVVKTYHFTVKAKKKKKGKKKH